MSYGNTLQALEEGWDLFDVDGRFQLQKLDDPASVPELGYTEPKFKSDLDALLFVAHQALRGSKYHRNALALIGTLTEP